MFMRLCALMFMVTATVGGLWWCALPVLAVYLHQYQAFELPLIAIMIDGYLGAFYQVPYLSICTTVLVLITEWLKPTLMFYTDGYDR